MTKGEFENAFKLFNVIEMPLKQFFDDNFVNVKEANIRENRLNLLSQIRNLFNKVIDFSRIDFS
jgi:glycyl-tRNA synthetase beta subunit